MNALTDIKLEEERIATAQEQTTPIIKAEGYGSSAYLPILAGKPIQEPATEQPHAQWLAVVHDVVGLGPAGFHRQTLERFAYFASYLALVSVAPDPSIYQALAGAAAVLGRVLVVETKLPLYAAWQRFLKEHSTRAPLVLFVPEGRQP
jgi:desulfoferrodoxin (superoxide reductase-like protein)